MDISTEFDGGNIEVVDASDDQNVQLKIRPDNQSEFYQWFFFRVSGSKGQACRYRVLNAQGAAYPDGFRNYRICYSYDREEWLRHPTDLNDGELVFEFTAKQDSVYFAYFAPYPMERHHKLVARAQSVEHCALRRLGSTLDGQDLDQLTFSLPNSNTKKQCWIIARQHPGETMAEWWMEACVHKLMDSSSELTQALLENCDLHLVPNMNPDGSRRGHLRTNAAGRNLNREWAEPSMDASPEVFLVKQAMAQTGVDFLLDVHGDEALPYCFIAGTEGLRDWGAKQQQQLDFYKNVLVELNADFQTKEGYPAKPPGTANLTMSTAQTAANHNCLAMTLEMPFKDTTATPDETYGWSPERSGRLAVSCLQALGAYIESGLMN
ncbi:MAG: M14-type cytosolic carboxypeptidase [Pseudomonadales bacterium]|nr:M14-type cytosolic carboxypeptidase [Pseudomonadales bacterium]